jgi:N-acetylmuramoyl-L-alanine amidase
MDTLSFVMMRILIVLMALLCQILFAQQAFVVNGQPLSGLSTTLIEGSSYIPATSLANAVGAQFSYDAQSKMATFDYASRFITLNVFDNASEAALATQALSVDGDLYASTAGVNVSGTVYVPVKPMIAALGGSLYYSEELQKVIVTFPRALLRSAYVQPSTSYDRLVFDFEGRTPYQIFLNPTMNQLQVRFSHLEPVTAQAFTGTLFTQAVLSEAGGFTDLVIELRPNIRFESYTTATPAGFSLIIDLFQAENVAQAPTVILDPGHGGQDTGIVINSTNEADLVLAVAQSLESLLNQNGIVSSLTRDGNTTLSIDERSEQGIGATLFLSLHLADLAPGQLNIYYLSEAPDQVSLAMAIARNAQQNLTNEATDSLRRRLLLRYVPDMNKGESYARAIADTLRQNPGYTISHMAGLPLKVLEGAAGRGVLLEFSANDLSNAQLPSFLTSAVLAALAVQ